MTPRADALRARFADTVEGVIGRWAIWIAAAVFGGACSALGYWAFNGQTAGYPDFVIGYITTSGSGKAGDYAMLFGFMLGSLAFFAAVAVLFRRLSLQGSALVVEQVYARFMIATIPAVMWAATSIWPQANTIGFFWGAVILVGATAIALGLVTLRPQVWLAGPDVRPLPVFDGVVLLPFAAILGLHAVAMFGNRIAILFGPAFFKNLHTFQIDTVAVGVGAAVVAAIVVLRASAPDRATAQLRGLLIALQALLPALFLAVLPWPVGPIAKRFHYADTIHASTWIFLGLITLAAWIDLARLWRKGARDNADPAAAVSLFSLAAIIVYARIPNLPPIGVPFDDYHAGEMLVPWWSWVKHGYLPLWDFTPARGLINYSAGALAALFTESTAAGLIATAPYHFIIVLLLVFPALALAVGKWRAFLILSFAALDEALGCIDALMAAGLCILCFAWTRFTPVRWLATWLTVGIAAVLVAPGQGGLLVIATAPGGLWQLYRAYREDRVVLLRTAAAALVVLAIVALATPLGLILAGAVRYGAGQSAVNGIANGIPWSFGSQRVINPWVFEGLRFAWIAVGAIAAVLTVWAWAGQKTAQRGMAIFLGGAVALLCAVFVIRSAVRIDAGAVSRPGFTSIWALAFLLPLLVTALLPERQRLQALIGSVAGAAMLATNFGIIGIEWTYTRPFLTRPAIPATQNVADGPALGMPNMGVVGMEQPHVDRLVKVKTQLDRLLASAETFLDMTNNGAQYYYFDRPPPSDLSAFYNTITPDQQIRTVARVIRDRVPVAVTGADTVMIDNLPANLRAALMYRYLALNFVPVTLDGYDYMLRPDRLARIGMAPADPATPSEDTLKILDRTFPVSHLGKLPANFGKSAAKLEDRARDVLALDPVHDAVLLGAERNPDNSYRVTGPVVTFTFDVSGKKLRGRDAGLVEFTYACLNRHTLPTMTVHWFAPGAPLESRVSLQFTGRHGRLIVPVDAAPRWLLAPQIGTLQIEMTAIEGCTAFTMTDIKLGQRLAADAIDKMAQAESAP